MLTKRLIFTCMVALALPMAGCSRQGGQDAAPATRPADPLQAVATQGKGFTVGAMMSANTVYVLFDPQCPHCGHLWQAIQPLLSKIKFVWIPVALMGGKSVSQGAALLHAVDPLAAMTEHEASLLANTGGIAVPGSVSAEAEQSVQGNTRLFNSLGVDSVPYILARNPRSGQVVTHNGAFGTRELAEFLGVELP